MTVLDSKANKKEEKKAVAATAGSSTKKSKPQQKKSEDEKPFEQLIMEKMAFYHNFGRSVTFDKLSSDCEKHPRSKAWLATWMDLRKKNLITVESGKARLTDAGVEAAGCVNVFDKSKLGDKQGTNEDWHAYIKSSLLKKGPEIFDLLLNDGPISRKDLAASLGTCDRSHGFSYGLKQLKELGFAEKDGKLWKLSGDAFITKKASTEPEASVE